jgi:hypothetical protein
MLLIVCKSSIYNLIWSPSLITVNGMLANEIMTSAHSKCQNPAEEHSQPLMRDTTIMAEEGFLGPHSPEQCAADMQSESFTKAEDWGPWYLSPEQQAILQHDQPTGKIKLVKRSKKQLLLDALNATGVMLQQERGYSTKKSSKILLATTKLSYMIERNS